MEIKDIIREKREELGLTYEELGKLVGVGKSTVRKWETGMIENMRRDNIVSLSKALNISPSVIMGWNSNQPELSNEELDLLDNFNKLNEFGKLEAAKRVEELTQISKYKYINYTLAAHDDNLDPELAKMNLEKAKAIFKEMDTEK